MGASQFVNRGKGSSMSDAYYKIIQEDREENGHQQGYSGTICSADGCMDRTENYSKVY